MQLLQINYLFEVQVRQSLILDVFLNISSVFFEQETGFLKLQNQVTLQLFALLIEPNFEIWYHFVHKARLLQVKHILEFHNHLLCLFNNFLNPRFSLNKFITANEFVQFYHGH